LILLSIDPEADREAWQGEKVGSACEDNEGDILG